MEHLIISGGEQYLPFARSRIKALRALGRPFASQKFEIEGCSVHVRIEGAHDFITLSGGGELLMLVQATVRQESRDTSPVVDYIYSRLFSISASGARRKYSGATRATVAWTATPNGITPGRAEWMALNVNDSTSDYTIEAVEGDNGALDSFAAMGGGSFVATSLHSVTQHSEQHWFDTGIGSGEYGGHGENSSAASGITRIIAGSNKIDAPFTWSSFEWDSEDRVGYIAQASGSGRRYLAVYPYVSADSTEPPNIYSGSSLVKINHTTFPTGDVAGIYDGDGNFTGFSGPFDVEHHRTSVVPTAPVSDLETGVAVWPQSHVLSADQVHSPEVLAFAGGDNAKLAQAFGAPRIRAARVGASLVSVRSGRKNAYLMSRVTKFGDAPFAAIFKADITPGSSVDRAKPGVKFFDMANLPWREEDPMDMKMKAALAMPFVGQGGTTPGFVQSGTNPAFVPWDADALPFMSNPYSYGVRGVSDLYSFSVSFRTRANRDTS